MAEPSPLLDVQDIRKSFSGLRASDGVSLRVAAGAFHAIIGPNGAGKSTLFNQIAGTLRPDSGRILFAGDDVTRLPAHRRFHRGISRTFQITSVLPRLTVRENLEIVLLSAHKRLLDPFGRAAGSHAAECRRLLALVALDAAVDQRAGALSHGDQKRLELAVALANEPRLLLLDEPTAGMAARERLDAIRTVRRIADERALTVLFTEHDMDVVFAVADRISVLHQGRIIVEGEPQAIRDNALVQEIYLGGPLDALDFMDVATEGAEE